MPLKPIAMILVVQYCSSSLCFRCFISLCLLATSCGSNLNPTAIIFLITISGRNFSPIPNSTKPLCHEHLLTRQEIHLKKYLHKLETGDSSYMHVQIETAYESREDSIETQKDNFCTLH